MPLYAYQIKALEEINSLFKTSNKVCLGVSCSGGKTAMAIKFVLITGDGKINNLN